MNLIDLFISRSSLRSQIHQYPRLKGSARVAVNEWNAYYSVRGNEILLQAGKEVTLKLEPASHTSSAEFRALKMEKRKNKCLYSDENPVGLDCLASASFSFSNRTFKGSGQHVPKLQQAGLPFRVPAEARRRFRGPHSVGPSRPHRI